MSENSNQFIVTARKVAWESGNISAAKVNSAYRLKVGISIAGGTRKLNCVLRSSFLPPGDRKNVSRRYRRSKMQVPRRIFYRLETGKPETSGTAELYCRFKAENRTAWRAAERCQAVKGRSLYRSGEKLSKVLALTSCC